MLERSVRGVRRPRLSRSVGRALGLAGFSAGLWLLGQGVASADVTSEPAPVIAAADTLLARTTDVASPVLVSVEAVAAPVVEVAHQVVPPVVTAVVAPVVSVVDDVVTPVVDPVLGQVDQVVNPVVPVPAVLNPVGATAAQALAQPAPVDAAPSSAVQDLRTDAVQSTADAGDDVELPAAPAAPQPYPALPVGSPVSVGGSTHSSPEQPSADLSAAVLAAGAAALAAIADDACDAAGNVAFDPSFSPD